VKLRAVNRVDDGRIVWFVGPDEEPPPGDHVTRVQLCRLDVDQPIGAANNVRPLDECPPPVKATFPSFAKSLANEGFAFLQDRVEAGGVGPVLVAVDDGHVVGAIGPMEIMADSAGCPRLLPPYFGVRPECRRRGHGLALWRSSMHWGHGNGATYQLVQTEIGGASDNLFAAEGLRPLGFVGVTNI
jgi:GNAT superfamily N-acetyltransferase